MTLGAKARAAMDGRSVPDLDEFLERLIETYLVYDIQFMERDDESGRGVGYPMLMTCCAGIEVVGGST